MSGDAGAMLPVVLKQLRALVEAARLRSDGGHDQGCDYQDQIEGLEPEEVDAVDEETACDCGQVEVVAALAAVRGSGVLG